jgi:S1-C subfamily serine protease
VTAGIVSALGREVEIINDRMRIESFIQTDAAINKGNSGGALVNTSGQLIGINTAIASQSGNYQGYGFAVPSNLAIKVGMDIIEYGTVQRPILGVGIGAVDYKRASELGMDDVMGVEILSVSQGDPAQLAGVQAGDVVLEVNGYPVNESNELQEKVAVMRPGETVTLRIWRDGSLLDKEVVLASYEQPEPEQLSFSEEIVPEAEEIPEGEGISSFESDLGFRVQLQAEENQTEQTLFEVTHVFKYSEAWNRGLRKGQFIVKVDGEKVEDIPTFKERLKKQLASHGTVMFEILSGSNTRGFVELQRK